MKKVILSALIALGVSACGATHGKLRPGEVMGTDIGTIIASEAGLDLSRANLDKMNSEIDKGLYFSGNGLTTRWYAGYNVRMRPIAVQRDRRDRECRRFRHGHMIDGEWLNATAIACRERNVAWYLIANRWDDKGRANRRDFFDERDDDLGFEQNRSGSWRNLGEDVSGNVQNDGFDDFGPRGGSGNSTW